MTRLILASSSPYRRELLHKLGIAFDYDSPDIDESPLEHESAEDLVARLALGKARAVADKYPDALIIGSDQVAVLSDPQLDTPPRIITKPHTHANAVQQLRDASGQQVTFLTSLCLLNTSSTEYQLEVVPYHVDFLALSEQQIDTYLHKEKPYNCAGSFKSEGLGITLFKRMQGDDPNSLVGLPLIALVAMLRNEGLEPLSGAH